MPLPTPSGPTVTGSVAEEIRQLKNELIMSTVEIINLNTSFVPILRGIEVQTFLVAGYLEESLKDLTETSFLMLNELQYMSGKFLEEIANNVIVLTTIANRSANTSASNRFDDSNNNGDGSTGFISDQFKKLIDLLKVPETIKKDVGSFWENLMKLFLGFKLIGGGIAGKILSLGKVIGAKILGAAGLGAIRLLGTGGLLGGISTRIKAILILYRRKFFNFLLNASNTFFGRGITFILQGATGILKSSLSILGKAVFGLLKWVAGLPFRAIIAIGAFLYGLFDTESARNMAGKGKGEEVTIWDRIRYAASNAVASLIGWFISPETLNKWGTKLFEIAMDFLDTIWVAIGGPEWYTKMKKKFDEIWTGFLQIIEDVIDFAKSWIPGMESKEEKKINDEKKKQKETKEKLLSEVDSGFGRMNSSSQNHNATKAKQEAKKLEWLFEDENTGEGETYSSRKTISDDNIEKLSKDQIAVLIQTKTFADNEEVEKKLLNAYNNKNTPSVSLPKSTGIEIDKTKSSGLQGTTQTPKDNKQKQIEEATKKPKEENKKENEKPTNIVTVKVDNSTKVQAQTSYGPSTPHFDYID